MSRSMRLAAALLAVGAAASCVAHPPESRPVVVVSVPPQKYLVDRLAPDLVRVEVMVPPGANPHSHEPSLATMTRLGAAALYVKVGHPHLAFEEAWLDPILAEAPGLPVVDGSAGIENRDEDPHVWVAPRHMEQMAVSVEGALEKVLPEHVEALRANLAAFRDEIAALESEIRQVLAGKRGHRFLVFHPAWGYFAEAFGLEQVAIEHDHKEPDPHALGELIERALGAGVKVVFVQPQVDAAAAETVAREIGARVVVLDPLAYDWPENLRHVARALAEGATP